MDMLLEQARNLRNPRQELPFAIYHCKKKQSLRRVPILKPVIVFILSGEKHLTNEINAVCSRGEFIFLCENNEVTISNIPDAEGYMALFIEFEYADFDMIQTSSPSNKRHLIGQMDELLSQNLYQFIQWAQIAPRELWPLRRRELLKLICLQGYKDIIPMVSQPGLQHQLIDILKQDPSIRWHITDISRKLAMSESSLRRRLQGEGTSFRQLDLQVRLGYGMHLLQTTRLSIALVAEKCGYQSQSRFTEKFKDWFGMSPLKLRQSQMNGSS